MLNAWPLQLGSPGLSMLASLQPGLFCPARARLETLPLNATCSKTLSKLRILWKALGSSVTFQDAPVLKTARASVLLVAMEA